MSFLKFGSLVLFSIGLNPALGNASDSLLDGPEPSIIYCDVLLPLQAKMRTPLAEVRFVMNSNCPEAVEISSSLERKSYRLVFELYPETNCLYKNERVAEIFERHGATLVGKCFSQGDFKELN